MKLKVCGMKIPSNIEQVSELRPDYMGFIFYKKSPRYFTGEIPRIFKSIKKVGVFVNADIEEVLVKIKNHDLQYIQLHGDESVEYCNKLNLHLNEESIIKVFSIDEDFDFRSIEPFEDCCEYYLFDTKGKLPGGNGYAFNWKILESYPSIKPYFLSGGIGLDSTEELNIFINSSASKYCEVIDVNSKFEVEPGFKDLADLNEFQNYIQNIHSKS